MHKIGVLGDKDSVMGFSALGLKVFMTDSVSEAKQMLHQMADENFAIIYITEQLARFMQTEIYEYKDKIKPAIIPIPNLSGSLGIGMSAIKNNIERAVGSDIL